MSFPGAGAAGAPMGIGGGGATAGMDPQQAMMVKYMQAAMESCPSKLVISGVMGFGLGGMFGIFMSSMRYDTPLSAGLPGGVGTTSTLSTREQLRAGFKDMGRSAYSSAKNFGYIGAIYAGSECAIEGFRAKNDLVNGASAGCFTGAFLAKGAGPQAMAIGCAGFAAFSTAIDTYMRMPSDDRAADPIM